MIGRTLSHYRIVEPLGAGGMGEVYRARDEKLGRDVAVKVLPADSLSDETARRRFRKEAEALVRLSHPHIATVFDVDSADGTDFIVMEVVPGPTLKERLQDGPLREKEVVRLGTQLVRGLMAAHEKGIVHRDLKPSNLSLTEDGLLKILDFGLVRLVQAAPGGGGETAPTETAAGRAAGTLPYMSPEQLRGRGVDARSDLYAVGAVLFELATGRRVFEQANEVELADAILHETPPSPRSVKSTLSPGLEAIVLKALDKDPELRYQTAREVLVDLERLQVSSTDSNRATLPTSSRSRAVRRKVALATCAFLALAVGLWVLRPLPPPRITNFRAVTGGLESGRSDHIGPHWSTDGVRLYYIAGPRDEEHLFQVPVTGGDAVEMELASLFFPELYGYVAPESALLMETSAGENTLRLVPVPAGAPRRTGTEGTFAAPSVDGETLTLVQSGRIVIVRRDGSSVSEITSLPTEPIRASLSPDRRCVRYEAPGPKPGERWIWETPVEGGRARPLWPGERGQWTPDGRYFLFDRFSASEDRHDLFAVREGRFPWSSPGTPVRLTSGPLSFYAVGPDPDGSRLFAWGTTRRGELLRYDAKTDGFERYLGGLSAYYVDGSLDGQWLTWVSFPDQTLWKSRIDGTDRLRLSGPGWHVHLPRWSPDGQQIVFAGRRGGEDGLGLYRVSAEGGEPETLAPWDVHLGNLWDPCWLPDGESVVYSHLGRYSSRDAGLSTEGTHPRGIYRLDLESREVMQLPRSKAFGYPKCSAQGDILVTDGAAGEGVWRYSLYSVGGATWEAIGTWSWAYPNWSRDGETITAYNQNERRIERWHRRTGRLEVVAHVGEIPLGSWANASWIGLAPDGSPLIMRDRSTRDLYALEWDAP